MATDTGRDDFVIAIRSAFLKRGTRQKFSLFTLLIISILVLSLEYFKSGPINTFRSITKDIIFKDSFFISEPFVYIKNNYYNFKHHLQMYDEYTELKNKDYNLANLLNENNSKVVSFIRLEVGEGIEVEQKDFASEVMSQIEET